MAESYVAKYPLRGTRELSIRRKDETVIRMFVAEEIYSPALCDALAAVVARHMNPPPSPVLRLVK